MSMRAGFSPGTVASAGRRRVPRPTITVGNVPSTQLPAAEGRHGPCDRHRRHRSVFNGATCDAAPAGKSRPATADTADPTRCASLGLPGAATRAVAAVVALAAAATAAADRRTAL